MILVQYSNENGVKHMYMKQFIIIFVKKNTSLPFTSHNLPRFRNFAQIQ